jgi:aminoglycoside N3'-acetyltransferase
MGLNAAPPWPKLVLRDVAREAATEHCGVVRVSELVHGLHRVERSRSPATVLEVAGARNAAACDRQRLADET